VRVVMHTGDDVLVRRPGKSTLFRLVGTGGYVEFYAWESAYLIRNAAHPMGAHIEVERHPHAPHRRYLDDLARQIDSGIVDHRLPEMSLTALELCEGAYLSARHRCKVTLPLAGFGPPAEPDWEPNSPYRGQGGRNGRQL